MELIINILMAAEVLVGVALIALAFREARFLGSLESYLSGESLPLYEILKIRARYISLIGVYLLVLTMIGAVVGPITEHFPLIRPINGAVFLWLIAGPVLTGRALRAK